MALMVDDYKKGTADKMHLLLDAGADANKFRSSKLVDRSRCGHTAAAHDVTARRAAACSSTRSSAAQQQAEQLRGPSPC